MTARWSGRRYEQLPCFFFSSASGPRYSNMLLILKLFPILFFSSGPARFLNGQRPDNKKVKRQRAWGTPWLKKIIFFFFFFIWVIGVLRRTVVCDWSFDNLCGSHLQSQVVVDYRKTITWHLASAQVVETSVTNNSLFSVLQSPRWSFSIKICYSWVQTIFLLRYTIEVWVDFFSLISASHNAGDVILVFLEFHKVLTGNESSFLWL